ncbi:STAS domain-containing protein [Streptosporangium sp. CA-135522]|uniref:STAS domain-containing protein n=1 Tax=Streptosporangium sp. CA-135522 TaxID=3240072 RepID=UPI003D8FE477
MTTMKTRSRRGAAPRPVHPAASVVPLYGEIDIFTSHALRERLLRVLWSSSGPLILDLSRVSFRDASGLAVLVGVQRRARALGIALRLSAPCAQTVALLRVTGLDRSFTIHGNGTDEPKTLKLPVQARLGD